MWVILCRLPEKGRRDRRDRRGDEREGQGRKRNKNESEETEEIKIFLYPKLSKILSVKKTPLSLTREKSYYIELKK